MKQILYKHQNNNIVKVKLKTVYQHKLMKIHQSIKKLLKKTKEE